MQLGHWQGQSNVLSSGGVTIVGGLYNLNGNLIVLVIFQLMLELLLLELEL